MSDKDIERHITVVVATTEFDYYQEYEDCCSHELSSKQESFALDDLLKQDWFVTLLKNKGYYSKDELGMQNSYLDNFTFEYYHGNNKFSYWANEIKDLPPHCNIKAVYQEVIGPERIKEFAKWKKRHEDYFQKQAELMKKDMEKKEAAKEKRRLKQLAKAKQLLEEEGII